MEIHNHSRLSLAYLAASPDLRPDIVVGQLVGKLLGSWTATGAWQLDWDAQAPVLRERLSTPWGDLCPDFHHRKAGCDLSVIGRVYSPQAKGCRQMRVHARVGDSARSLWVFGPRRWQQGPQGELEPSPPEPFGILDMVWSNSFGGRCKDADGAYQSYLFNPEGMGFQCCPTQAKGALLARIEDPNALVRRPLDRPMPINLAAIPAELPLNLYPDPVPLAQAMLDQKQVKLPPSFHNWAHPKFRFSDIAPGAEFYLEGMDTGGGLLGALPELRFVAGVRLGDRRHRLCLEPSSIVIFPESRKVSISYSAHFAFRWVPEERREIELHALGPFASLSQESNVVAR